VKRRSFLWLALAGCGSKPRTREVPEELREEPEAALPPPSGLEAMASQLRERHRADGFTVIVEPPFLVVGDEDARTVRERSQSTVAWAVDRLKRAYFDRDPAEKITIWLFDGDASYEHWAWELFGDRPDTPYGYYSPQHSALVMNIATGGGTLVHEIVHPFIDTNFPECPSWFDEGLASLYEQCGDVDGEITGFTNWRLAGLQDALSQGTVPSFATLTATTRDEFYEEDPGTNYAQARYLCYWLQEHGLLREFYRAFAAGAARDPTGFETLRSVVGYEDMRAWERDWQKFTLALRFP
jgi:hypothetical protein